MDERVRYGRADSRQMDGDDWRRTDGDGATEGRMAGRVIIRSPRRSVFAMIAPRAQNAKRVSETDRPTD